MPGTPALYIVADCSQTAHTSKRTKIIKKPMAQAKNAVHVMQSPQFLHCTCLGFMAEQLAAQSPATQASMLAKSIHLLKYNL